MRLTNDQIRHQFWLDHPQLDRTKTPASVVQSAMSAYFKLMRNETGE
jgi:hypothetical protein